MTNIKPVRTIEAARKILSFMAEGQTVSHSIFRMVSEEDYRPMTAEECDPIDTLVFKHGTNSAVFAEELKALICKLEA